MGLNCVAILLNDCCGEIERNGGTVGPRMSRAMQDYAASADSRHDGYFHVGKVISRDHADGYQVTVVHGNTGQHITEAANLPPYVLSQLADCLTRHGWNVTSGPKKLRTPFNRARAGKRT